jgi:hypothetical protein
LNPTLCADRRRSSRASVALIALATSVACSKSPASGAPSPSASAVAASSSSPTPSGSSAPASAASAASGAWSGAYTAKVGAVDPPKNAKEKTWTEDPGSVAVGKGTVELAISGPRGDVTGEAKGPLGEMIVAGTFDGKELRANLTPKNPKGDGAMTGFMELTGDGPETSLLKGNIRASGRDARIVREATVEISKK